MGTVPGCHLHHDLFLAPVFRHDGKGHRDWSTQAITGKFFGVVTEQHIVREARQALSTELPGLVY
jgi:hypothetical protein